MNTQELQRIIDQELTVAGFRRSGQTWRRANDDTISVLNLQKSAWGGQFYINLGIYLRDLGNNSAPLEQHCHIRARLNGLDRDKNALEHALNLESTELSWREREQIICESVQRLALPFLDNRSTLAKLHELYASGELERGPIMLNARAREFIHGS